MIFHRTNIFLLASLGLWANACCLPIAVTPVPIDSPMYYEEMDDLFVLSSNDREPQLFRASTKKSSVKEPFLLWKGVVPAKGGRFVYWTRTYYTTRGQVYYHSPWELGVTDLRTNEDRVLRTSADPIYLRRTSAEFEDPLIQFIENNNREQGKKFRDQATTFQLLDSSGGSPKLSPISNNHFNRYDPRYDPDGIYYGELGWLGPQGRWMFWDSFEEGLCGSRFWGGTDLETGERVVFYVYSHDFLQL